MLHAAPGAAHAFSLMNASHHVCSSPLEALLKEQCHRWGTGPVKLRD